MSVCRTTAAREDAAGMSDFDVIMSISSEMIVVVDEAYIMRHATLSFLTEFAIEPETAVGRPLSEVLPQVLTQVLMSHRDGSLMQVLTTTQPLELHCLADHQNYRVRVNGQWPLRRAGVCTDERRAGGGRLRGPGGPGGDRDWQLRSARLASGRRPT